MFAQRLQARQTRRTFEVGRGQELDAVGPGHVTVKFRVAVGRRPHGQV